MGERLYDWRFACCYIANLMFLIGSTTLVRYSDFVVGQLGGSELDLGLVVGFAMVGALGARCLLGPAMDRWGAASVWLTSVLLFVVAITSHTLIQSPHSPALYLARWAVAVAAAGTIGASLTFITLRVAEGRTNEAIAVIGTSGFAGLALGPVLADWMIGPTVDADAVRRLFLGAAAAGLTSFLFAAIAVFGVASPTSVRPRRKVPSWRIVPRYQSGRLLLVAAAMGLGFSVPGVFLQPFIQQQGLGRVRDYFLLYAAVAFVARFVFRNLPARWGAPRVISLGLVLLGGGTIAFSAVNQPLMLAIPAVVGGIAHAIVYPAVVTESVLNFPRRYRGLAMTVVLAMVDLGGLIGYPLAGGLITLGRSWGMPEYEVMFALIGGMISVAAAAYTWLQAVGPARRGDWTTRVAPTPVVVLSPSARIPCPAYDGERSDQQVQLGKPAVPNPADFQPTVEPVLNSRNVEATVPSP